jgi:hypothetical protein
MAGVMFVKGCLVVVELVVIGGDIAGGGVDAALEPEHLLPSQVCPSRQIVAGIVWPVVLFLHCPLSNV